MGFLDDLVDGIDSIFSDEPTTSKKTKKSPGIVETVANGAIEKSLWGVRKFYEGKVELINWINDIDPDWYFYDNTLQTERVENIKDNLKAKISSLHNLQNRLKEKNQDLMALKNDLYHTLDNDERNTINRLISEVEQNIAEYNKEIISLNQEIADFKIYLLKQSCFIINSPNEFMKNIDYAVNNEINNAFVKYGILSLVYYLSDNRERAIQAAMKYLASEEIKEWNEEPPLLVYLIALGLIEEGELTFALNLLGYVVVAFPENLEVHKTLMLIYERLGKIEYIKREKAIIELLE